MAIAEAPRFVRADGPDKVTGSGRYVADMNLTGQLVAKFKCAGVAHARIMRLDVSSARAIPGVFAVLTAADVPDVVYSPVVPDRRLFATEVVRFEGELLAAVAAVDAATAQAAVDAIVVEYEPLPIVDDLEAAIAEGSPLVHEGWEEYTVDDGVVQRPNVSSYSSIENGDVEAAMVSVDRARDAGFEALVVTVDSPTYNNREIDIRNGATLPPRITVKSAIDSLRHPRWLFGTMLPYMLAERGMPGWPNIHIPEGESNAGYGSGQIDSFMTRIRDDEGASADDNHEFNVNYIIRQLQPMRDGPADDEMHVLLQLQPSQPAGASSRPAETEAALREQALACSAPSVAVARTAFESRMSEAETSACMDLGKFLCRELQL